MSAKSEDTRLSAEDVITALLVGTAEPTALQWKALIDRYPHYANEIAEAALEYRTTQHLTLDDLNGPAPEMYARTLSWAINAYHTTPRPESLALERRIQEVKGPAARPLARTLGLGKNVVLLNGVLSGRIRSPRRITARLAETFETRVGALTDVFAREFARQPAPAFKAERKKPQIRREPQPWDEAVRSLGLSEDETNELLALDT